MIRINTVVLLGSASHQFFNEEGNITDDDEDIVEVISRTIKPFRAFGSKVITCTAANRKWETVKKERKLT